MNGCGAQAEQAGALRSVHERGDVVGHGGHFAHDVQVRVGRGDSRRLHQPQTNENRVVQIIGLPERHAHLRQKRRVAQRDRDFRMARAGEVERLTDREQTYLLYRYGFTDGEEHPLIGTAIYFHLTKSRAKKTEEQAMDNLWLELPWWFD